MSKFFLFSRRPGADQSPGRKAVFWCWNWGFVLLSALGIGLVCLLLAFGPYGLGLSRGLLDTGESVLSVPEWGPPSSPNPLDLPCDRPARGLLTIPRVEG